MESRKDNISIFAFDSLSNYLTSVFQERKVARRSFSLRSWAMKLGQKPSDSGNLSRILSGQRDIPDYLVGRFIEDLALDQNEKVYFELLAVGRRKLSNESLSKIRFALTGEETPMKMETDLAQAPETASNAAIPN